MVGAIDYIRAKHVVDYHCGVKGQLCERCPKIKECMALLRKKETDAEHVERIMRWAKEFKEEQNG